MLVATAGHPTASYSTALHSKASTSGSTSTNGDTANIVTTTSTSAAATTSKRLCRDPLPGTSTPKESYTTTSTGTQSLANPTKYAIHTTVSTNSLTNGLLKTLSVRFSRGTEFLKDTVQKAIINTATNSLSLSVSAGTNFSCTTSSSNSSAGNVLVNYVAKPNGPVTNALNNSSASSSSSSSAVSARDEKTQRRPLKRAFVAPTEEFLALYAVAPVQLHRNPQADCPDETDSIEKEYMCHFRPIRSAPTTPAKISSRSRGIAMKTPKAKFAPRVKVDFILQNPSLVVGDDNGVQQQQLNDNNDDDKHNSDDVIVYEYLKPKPNITTLPTIYTPPKHPSAFVYLIPHMRDITNAPSNTEKSAMADRTAKAQPKAKTTRKVRRFPELPIDNVSSVIKTKFRAAPATKHVAAIKAPPKRLGPTKGGKTPKLTGLAANKKKTAATASSPAKTTAVARVTRKKPIAVATPTPVAAKKSTATTKRKRTSATTAVKKSAVNTLDVGKSPSTVAQRGGSTAPRITRSQLMHAERQLNMREQRQRATEERRMRNRAIDVTSSTSSTLQQIMKVHRSRNVDALKVPAKRSAAAAVAAIPAKKTKPSNNTLTSGPAMKRARLQGNAYKASTSTATVGDTVEAPATKRGRGRPRLAELAKPLARKMAAPTGAGEQHTPPLTRARAWALALGGGNK